MPLLRFLAARRERRQRVERDATDILFLFGDLAYAQSRSLGCDARTQGDTGEDRHWSRVAVVVADRTGRVIGERVDDRYEASRRTVRPTEGDDASRPSGSAQAAAPETSRAAFVTASGRKWCSM